MLSTTVGVCCAIFVAIVTPVDATVASAQVFPSLRKKRLEKEKEMQEKSHVDALSAEKIDAVPVVVPPPVDAGTDGFPVLPAVSTMLSAASGTLKTVNSQASTLQARVVQAQMQSEAKMARQKAAFEEKLKQQEENNRMVMDANTNISATISQLQDENAALRKHAHQVEEASHLMRNELHALQSRLGAAKDFAAHSLKSTDDSKNELLQVLKIGGGHHHHHNALVETSSAKRDDDDSDDDEDEDTSDDTDSENSEEEEEESDEADSFLAVSMQTRRKSSDNSFESAISEIEAAVPPMAPVLEAPASPSDPNDLLEVLAKQVANLAQQEKESEKTLKSLFIRDFRAGAKRHQALLAQQKHLLATQSSLQALQAKLKDAVAHLEATKTELQSRLKGLGQFLQKLAHFALAPQREVSHLMEVLPKTIFENSTAESVL